MNLRTFSTQLCITSVLVLATSLLATSSVSGGEGRRFFRMPSRRSQPVQYVQQPQSIQPTHSTATPLPIETVGATSTVPEGTSPTPAYHTPVHQPAVTTVAPVTNATTSRTQPSYSGSHYRGTMRYEGNHPVPNLFRGDSKILGLRRN